MNGHKISRRAFLRLCALAAGSAAATRCQAPLTPSVSHNVSVPSSTFYHESPQLARRVVAGDLPPVAERLPKNPLLIQPVERAGRYGGTWRRGMLGNRDHANLIRTLGYENLMRWDAQWTRVLPNVAQSVQVNAEATEYRFQLRAGMCWSDGAPFTADDILFWYQAVFSNSAFTDAIPPWLTSGGVPVVVEKVDDYTISFRFAAPNGLFLQNLAHPWGAEPTSYPRHYLAPFHADYNPNISHLVQAAGVANWVELFERQVGKISTTSTDHPTRWSNPELPTLNAWVLVNGYQPNAETVMAERNPYYWKIDIQGRQLPYIDRIVYQVAQDKERLVVQAISGKIDMQSRHIATDANRSLFEYNMRRGNYHFFKTLPSFANMMAISLNLTHPNPTLRQIFQNRDLRIGLSHAINRQAIIDRVYNGQGKPYQVAPAPSSSHYHAQLATQYLEYDVALANQYLDQAGYKARDAQGFRLRPDGAGRIQFSVDVSRDPSENKWPEAMAHVQEYWRTVGIDVHLQIEARERFYERVGANAHDAAVWYAPGGLDVILAPRYFFPASFGANYAIAWASWYQNPQNPLAEVPPPAARQQMQLYDQLIANSDPAKQGTLMQKILDIAADQFYVIGLSLPAQGYGIVKNNFYNVPAIMPHSWTYPNPAPTNPAQYFIEPSTW